MEYTVHLKLKPVFSKIMNEINKILDYGTRLKMKYSLMNSDIRYSLTSKVKCNIKKKAFNKIDFFYLNNSVKPSKLFHSLSHVSKFVNFQKVFKFLI